VTLATYLHWWLEDELVQRVADGTIVETTRRQYANKVCFQITPLLGTVRLQDLSPMQIRQWLAILTQQGGSPSLRKDAHAVLNNALQRAVRYELLPSNPARVVDAPKVYRERRPEITLTPHERCCRPSAVTSWKPPTSWRCTSPSASERWWVPSGTASTWTDSCSPSARTWSA
jgi:hypothetical protein